MLLRKALQTTVFILLILQQESSCFGQSRRPKTVTLGCFVLAYAAASETLAVQELELTGEQESQLTSLAISIPKSQEYRQLAKKRSRWHSEPWDAEAYFREGFVAESEFAEKINRNIMRNIGDILDDSNRTRRFRELYTQYLLKRRDFDSILRLHHIKLDAPEYNRLDELRFRVQMEGDFTTRLCEVALERWMPAHLTSEEIDRINSEIYTGDFPPAGAPSLVPSSRWFKDIAIRMITMVQIQKELEMDVDQANKAIEARTRINTTMSEELARQEFVNWGESPEFVKKMETWRKSVDKEIDSILRPEQRHRLNQLLFQYHLRRHEVSWALVAAGKPLSPHLKPGLKWNEIQAEAFCLVESDKLRYGTEVLSEFKSPRFARQLCGRVPVPISPWSHLLDAETKKELANIFLEGLRPVSDTNPVNPRRNDRRKVISPDC